MKYVRENILQMDGYTPGYQPGEEEGAFIKLNTNENPYPPSPRAVNAMREACEESIRKYPQPQADGFRTTAAGVLGVNAEEILCGAGSDDLLTIAIRTFCREGDAVAFPYPSYSLYEVLAQIQDTRSQVVDFNEDYSLPTNLAETGAKLTLLANPNAPSGTMIPPPKIKRLAQRLDGILLVDEAYVDFANENCLNLINECENLIVTRTLSKSYSLAGLRFGFALANSRLIGQMAKVKDSYNVSTPAIAGATAAIEDQQWLNRNVSKIKHTRTKLTTGLSALGFSCPESEANFVLAKVPEGFCAKDIFEKLYQNKILVRYFNMPRLDDCLRITVGTAGEIDWLLEILDSILKNQSELY